MEVVEGRGDTTAASRRAVAALYDRVTNRGEPVVWVWRPHRQVAFGPRDVTHDGYDAAAAATRRHGYEPIERSVGGHPVAHTGDTLAFVRAAPIDDPRRGLSTRYDAVLERIADALADCGAALERGEPSASFCPGAHSLSAGGKVVGLAQRVTASFAAVSGVVVVDDASAVAEVLEPVYAALELAFDPASVGSVAAAGGPGVVPPVADAIEGALVGGERPRSLSVDRLIEAADD